MNAKRTFYLFVALAALLVLLAAGASAHSRADYMDLTGSWVVHVNPDPATGVPPFDNLSAFTQDGRVIGSDNTGLVALGEWARTGASSFATTFVGLFVQDDQQMSYKVRGSVTISADGEALDGPFLTEMFDAEGNLTFSINGTVHGERLHVEPLPGTQYWQYLPIILRGFLP